MQRYTEITTPLPQKTPDNLKAYKQELSNLFNQNFLISKAAYEDIVNHISYLRKPEVTYSPVMFNLNKIERNRSWMRMKSASFTALDNSCGYVRQFFPYSVLQLIK